MHKTTLVLGALAISAISSAIITETEINDDASMANTITRGSVPWVDIGVLSLGGGANDNDWFKISLSAGETITAITTPLRSHFDAPDTVMALVDPTASSVLVFNDDIDGANNRGSAWAYTVSSTGTYYIAITGYNGSDQSLVSTYLEDHGEFGDYQLMVGIVPEPATMAALGVGIVAVLSRRRRK